ncbi:MAG: glycosyltransferase [Saprospiraceae bacterium]
MGTRLVVGLYGHPEAYPPTLNALNELSGLFDEVDVLFRPHCAVEWDYPANVKLHPSGAAMSPREQEALPLPKRWGLVVNFIKDMAKLCKEKKTKVILLYDPLALMAFLIARVFLHNPPFIVWYHNHDVLEANQKRFSLNWCARSVEKKAFLRLNIFSLPSNERKEFFPMKNFQGKYFFLPNLPAVSFYSQFQNTANEHSAFRIIFQGHIDAGHGIEEILNLMPANVTGKPIHLVLKGWIRDRYKTVLTQIIEARGLRNDVEFAGYTAYQELPKLTASCHAGLAIHTKADIMNKTLGTASNKIYEYAAVGLPLLYFDNPHFNEHLEKYEWAFATDLSAHSLKYCFEQISARQAELSRAARKDFMTRLNYECHFQPLRQYLEELLKQA